MSPSAGPACSAIVEPLEDLAAQLMPSQAPD
jgi:hypothetical protein